MKRDTEKLKSRLIALIQFQDENGYSPTMESLAKLWGVTNYYCAVYVKRLIRWEFVTHTPYHVRDIKLTKRAERWIRQEMKNDNNY